MNQLAYLLINKLNREFVAKVTESETETKRTGLKDEQNYYYRE